MHHADLMLTQPGATSLGQAALRIKRAESSQRRLQGAMRTLAMLRTLTAGQRRLSAEPGKAVAVAQLQGSAWDAKAT
jgi:hypothetical protein